MGRELIAYYSRRGQNLVGGKLQNLTVGNTELAAELIRVFIQGDLFRIEPVRDYPPDFCRCIDQARQDLLRGARLELRAWPENWMKYETVYLGYPNHWNTLPVPVLSFVEGLDWAGKAVRPFCVHDGDGMGCSVAELRRLCPTARVEEGLPLYGGDIRRSLAAIEDWLDEETWQADIASEIEVRK